MSGESQRQQCGYECDSRVQANTRPRSSKSRTRRASASLKNIPPTSGRSVAKIPSGCTGSMTFSPNSFPAT